jgi:hydroxymethylpyrimidine kinase/phosphomethylpyrimidine kinase
MSDSEANKVPLVLSIAGLDPSGGAGILVDTRTIGAFGCASAAAITSITFQNSERVYGCIHQDAVTVRSQILPVLRERRVDCVKTGMLPTSEIVIEVANLIKEHNLGCLVVDPIITSTSGYNLQDEAATFALREKIFPAARVITPNIPEAEHLVGFSIGDELQMRRAAGLIREMGAQAVLLKGGHIRNATEALDLLDDGGEVTVFRGEWIEGGRIRGSGCMLSAALAACLAKGASLPDAVRQAKDFVREALRRQR